MANLNKVFLIGRLTRDPELRFTPGGTAVAEFGLATNRQWTDQSGEKKESTCFVEITAYGRQGEVINDYLKKGRQVFIEGRLDFSSWEGQDGKKQSRLRVVVEGFQFLDGGRRSEDASGGDSFAPEVPSAGSTKVPASRSRSGSAPAPATDPPAGPPPPVPGEDYHLSDPPF